MMKQWSSDVVLCTDALEAPSPGMQERLEQHGIGICPEKFLRLEGSGDGSLQTIHLASGGTLGRNAMFFTTGCFQHSDLWASLGCTRDEKGGIVINPGTEETSAPGVYVAGDSSRDVLLVAVAFAEGVMAGVAINRALLQEDGLG